jgi:hypothetical protein
MTKDEALRLALEALEDIGDEWGFTSQRTVPKRKEAITCLRLVIDAENISSKPMAWEQFYPEMGKPKLAYLSPTESPENACYIPPQRTWVGMTDEELSHIEGTHIGRSFARAIEAKLKEKNT